MSADAAFAVVRSWMASKLNTPKAVIDALQRFIADNAVGFREMADIDGHTLIGRDSASRGDPQSIGVGGNLEFTGTGAIQRSAITGDVLAAAGSGVTTFRNGTALSILGNATNASATLADIVAASDGQVMRRSGTALAFGAVNLASANAVTGILPFGNGGTGQSAYTDGQLLIGNTSTGGLTKATLTAGTGITITNAGGSITIDAAGGSGTVSSVSSANSDLTVATGTTTPVLTINSAPKLDTARTIAMSGDVVWSTSFDGSGNVTAAGTIQSNAVTTGKINNSAVTLAKIANASANSVLLGAGAAGSGAAYAEISLGSGLTMTGTTLSASGASGTVTHTVGALTSGQLIVGNGTADIKTGDLSGDVSTSGSGVTTIGALKVATGMIQASAVTYAKIQNVSANSVLLGAGASGSGSAPVEIALGSGLTMTGTTLSASGSVSGANPTATASNAAVNGSAATFMRSDAAPAVQLGSTSQFGLLKADGSTIVVAGGVISATGSASGGTTVVFPMGRLTLTSGAPVMTANATAQTSVYYTPYVGALIPIYNGTSYDVKSFSELTMTLNTSNQLSGNLYDLFVFNNSGTITIGAGPAWSSTTARGTGAGTTEIQLFNGVWTNKNTITLKNGSTTYSSLTANTATYVGTVYATANGQTGMNFTPAAAAGGTNSILGVYNAYNRVQAFSACRDSTSISWTYSSATWRAANASSSNRISFVDGLQQSMIDASYGIMAASSSTAFNPSVGINFNSTTATPFSVSGQANTPLVWLTANASSLPLLGFNYAQAMEAQLAGGTATFYCSPNSAQFMLLLVKLLM